MAVSKRTRFEVLRRDNFTCRYCCSVDNPLVVDHVIPIALGGTDDPTNLVAACQDCNAGKTSTSPDEPTVADVAADVLRWGRALEAAVILRGSAREKRDLYVGTFEIEWSHWRWGNGETMPRPPNWKVVIWRFYDLGLPLAELIDAVEIACSSERISVDSAWRYMCGVAWRQLRDLQEMAREQPEWSGSEPADG